MADYNEDIVQYNQEIEGKVYYGDTPELAAIEAWEARLEEKSQVLDELAEELGDYLYEPLGIVESVKIYW